MAPQKLALPDIFWLTFHFDCFIHSFTHSFNKCSLSTYCESGTVLGTWDIVSKRHNRYSFSQAHILMEIEMDNRQ